MPKSRVFFSLSIAVMALALTACPSRKSISEITADPGRYQDKEVTIVGRVTRSYGALGYGIFEVDDGTGRIWVFTEKYGVPSKDTYIGVSGRVTPGVTYSGRNYGTGIHESKRRTREGR